MSDEFLQLLAQEAIKSPAVARRIANGIPSDSVLFEKLIEKIDVNMLTNAIVNNMMERGGRSARFKYILNDAEARAKEKIANHIANEVMNA